MDYKPNNVDDCVNEVKSALEKSQRVLDYLIQEYNFSINPETRMLDSDTARAVWIFKHSTVMTFIEIVSDYVYIAAEVAEHANKLQLGGDLNE